MKTTLNSIVAVIAALALILAASIPVRADEVILAPNGAGDSTLLDNTGSPPNPAANWQAVLADDGDVSFVNNSTSGWRTDLYNLQDSSASGTINSVTVWIKARVKNATVVATAQTAIKTGTTVEYGSPTTLGTAYATYSMTYTMKPGTTDPWTWADIDALQAGVSLVRADSGNWSRCTQVWVVVDYTPAEPTCETAFAFGGGNATCFLEIEGLENNRWGWTNGPLAEDSYTFDLYAAAGQCDLSKGTLVGGVTVVYTGGTATVTYSVNAGFALNEVHLYVGSGILPMKDGEYTVAPGQYPYSGDGSEPFVISGLSGDIYVIAHAVVCGVFPAEG